MVSTTCSQIIQQIMLIANIYTHTQSTHKANVPKLVNLGKGI